MSPPQLNPTLFSHFWLVSGMSFLFVSYYNVPLRHITFSSVLGQLLGAILSLVTGLTSIILPLVGNLVPIIVSLNIGQILSLLGLSV
jgi:hypothetical protein